MCDYVHIYMEKGANQREREREKQRGDSSVVNMYG